MNREEWLQSAVGKLRPFFLGKNFTVPELYVSCGFPSRNATGTLKRAIGECWDGLQSADKKPQLFISPFLVEAAGPQGVLATLVHEIVHATIGCEAKHGPRFVKAMKAVGLEGKPTATSAGEDLVDLLKRIADELGAYPHSELKLIKERKKQTTRMRKCSCPQCEYTVRLSQKWADVGIPVCPRPGHPILKMEKSDEKNTSDPE